MAKFNPFNQPASRDEDRPEVPSMGPCAICGEEILRPYIEQSDDELGTEPPIPDRGHHVEDAGTPEMKAYHADCWFGGRKARRQKVAA